MEVYTMIGWRKMVSWLLVFALVAISTYMKADIQPNAKDVLIWATGFFFGANALKPLAQGIKVNIGQGE